MYPIHKDESGSFQELAHSDDVVFGQLSILKINPRCVRGGHYHPEIEEWFCCTHGKCMMEIQNVKDFSRRNIVLVENNMILVHVKTYESHLARNLSDTEICELLIIASKIYNPNNTGTIKFDIVENEQ